MKVEEELKAIKRKLERMQESFKKKRREEILGTALLIIDAFLLISGVIFLLYLISLSPENYETIPLIIALSMLVFMLGLLSVHLINDLKNLKTEIKAYDI